MNPYEIIAKYYTPGSDLYNILVKHSEAVRDKALELARRHPELGLDLEFIAEVPRSLGASAVVLRICRDGESDRDLPFSFTDSDGVRDIYALSIDTAEICAGEGSGLFFYELLFLRGLDTLFTNTYNNIRCNNHLDC